MLSTPGRLGRTRQFGKRRRNCRNFAGRIFFRPAVVCLQLSPVGSQRRKQQDRGSFDDGFSTDVGNAARRRMFLPSFRYNGNFRRGGRIGAAERKAGGAHRRGYRAGQTQCPLRAERTRGALRRRPFSAAGGRNSQTDRTALRQSDSGAERAFHAGFPPPFLFGQGDGQDRRRRRHGLSADRTVEGAE